MRFYTYDEFILEQKIEKSVVSNHLAEVKYDDVTLDLDIEFVDGSVYKYKGVAKDVFDSFNTEDGESTYGTRFWETIRRGGYDVEQIK